MLIDDLIEKLYELKKEYGNKEVILWTQRDPWSYDEHEIDKVYYTENGFWDTKDIIAIQGKDKTQDYSEPFDNADDFIESLLEQEE